MSLPCETAVRLRRNDPVFIPIGQASLDGRITIPGQARALVVLASAGKFVQDRSDREIAERLGAEGCAVLLVELLTRDHQMLAAHRGELRISEELLAERIDAVLHWLEEQSLSHLPMFLFEPSTAIREAPRSHPCSSVDSGGHAFPQKSPAAHA